MNKNLYRIIFSKARNMFIAVAENSKSQTKAAGESACKGAEEIEAQDGTALHQHWVVKSLVASISLWMPLAPVYAQIQADAGANPANRPVIGVGQNAQGQNVPVVNIQTPVNGVSHNIYKQMDVLSNGAVLNNSRTGAASAIAGSVGANPFLAKGEARLILNEINSTAATRFEGNLEVAGQRADVVIANPAGINIKGGGFINANKAIFTTGKPQLNADGSLKQFAVDQGKVTVSANAGSSLGLGGNSNNADYVDIYARALELNAQLHANQAVNVITGANTVSENLESIESKTSASAAPALAVDIKSLGGMYANNIYLMGNEKGLGVSNAGTLQAVNNLVVTSAGKIVHSGTAAASDKKGGLVSIATTGTGADADILVSGGINGYGLMNINSGNDLNLNAKEITVNYDAETKNSAALIVNAKGNVGLAAGTRINNLSTAGDLYLDAKNITLAENSEIRSNRGAAFIHADESLAAAKGVRLVALNDLKISADTDIRLLENTLHSTSGSINIQSAADTANLLQVDGGTVYAGQDLNVYGAGDVSLKNMGFNLVNDMTRVKNINAYSGKNLVWNNSAKLLPKIAGKVQLEAKQGLDLSGTAINAVDGIVTLSDTLTLSSALRSDKGIDLTAQQAMNLNYGSKLNASGDIALSALQGSIQAGSLKADTQGKLTILANKDVTLSSTQNITGQSYRRVPAKTTDKTQLNADKGIIVGSAGDGNVSVASADVISNNGDIQLLGKRGVNVHSNIDTEVLREDSFDEPVVNKFNAKSVSVETQKGNIAIKNAEIISTVGSVSVNSAEGMLTVLNSTLKSKGNTEIYAKDLLTLKNVTANSDQHLAVNSKRTIYLNADYAPAATVWDAGAKTALTAKGILSLTAEGNQVMQNATLTGGAVLLETSNLFVKPGLVFNAAGSDLLKNDAKLNSLNGDLSIQTSGEKGLKIDPKIMSLSAVGDIELIAKNGALQLAGYSGENGNGSEQIVKLNTVGGGISLEGTKIDIQGAQLTAQKDIEIVSSSDDVLIDGVKNKINYGVSKVALNSKNRELIAVNDELNKIKESNDYLEYGKIVPEFHRAMLEFRQNEGFHPQNSAFQYAMSLQSFINREYSSLLNEIKKLETKIQNIKNEINYHTAGVNGYEHNNINIESSSGGIHIISAKGLSISGAELTAKAGQINLESRGVLADQYTLTANPGTAAQAKKISASMIIDGHTNFYDKGNENDANYSMRTLVNPTVINGAKGVSIRTVGTTSDDNLVMQATGILSQGDVKIESNKNILFDSAIEQSYDRSTTTEKKKSWGGLKKKYITTVSENNAADAASVDIYGKNISIESKDQNKNVSIDIYSGKFTADGGKLSIKAGGNLNFYTVEESSSSNIDITKKSSFAGIKYNRSSTNATRTQATELPATLKADYIGTKSGFDTRLEGTEFEYLKDATVEAGGKLELIAAKTSITELLKKEKNSVVWQSMQDKGSITETAQLPQFNGPVLPTFKAAGGLSVQIPISEKDQNKAVIRDEILKLANQPGNAYLKELVNRKDVDWNTVILAQKDWDYKSQGLTGAGAAIIAIIVVAVTAGAGAAVVGALGGSAATLGGSAVLMTQAAVTSLATQASISIVNNGGNIGATLKDLGSKESIRNLVTAVVTVGIMDKVGGSLNINLNDMPRLENFSNNFIQGVSSNIISNTIQGESLSDTLDKALIAGISSSLQGEFAQSIKQLEDVDYVLHKIAHAAAGCAVGTLQKSCEAGAIGAGIGEIVAEELLDGRNPTFVSEQEKQKIEAYSKLIAGTISAYAGYDVNTAANSATVAINNNAFKDKALIKLENGRKVLTDKGKVALDGLINAYKKGDLKAAQQFKAKLDDEISDWASSGDSYNLLGVDSRAALGALVYAVSELVIPVNITDIGGAKKVVQKGVGVLAKSSNAVKVGDPKTLADELAQLQKIDIRVGVTLPGAKAPITVTAETNIGGKHMFDTNQTARPEVNRINTPTLATGTNRIDPKNPNLTMKNAHAEVALIQRAYDKGLTKGETMQILVRGADVCSHCNEVMTTMYERSGLSKLVIHDTAKGITTTYFKTSNGKTDKLIMPIYGH